MSTFEIPLTPQAQTFSVVLAGVSYNMKLRWCSPAAAWILGISDANGDLLIDGIPLITGADLLAQYEYLGIGGSLVAQTDHDINAPPTYDNLGGNGKLYFITPD